MKYKIAGLILAATFSLTSQAQELRSAYFMQTSTNRHELNPALLDSAYVGMPLLFGNFNLGTYGNAGLSDFIYKMEPNWQGYGEEGRKYTTFMHPAVPAEDFLNGLYNKTRIGLELKYQLLGFAFKAFKGTNLVELNFRSNTSLNVPKDMFAMMKTLGGKEEYALGNIGVRTENYAELALGHSHAINEKITVGAKLKFLVGLAYADFSVDKLNLRLAEDQWMVDGKINAAFGLGKSTLAYESEDKNYIDPEGNRTDRRRISGIDEFKPALSGFGFAVDLGATYKPIEDLTLSFSVTDLGLMNYTNIQRATSGGKWTFDGFKDPIKTEGYDPDSKDIDDQIEQIGDDLENLFAVYEDPSGKKSEKRMLAATINVGAEYALPVYKPLRFGFLYSSRIAGPHSWHSGMLSATVRPVKWFEASLTGAMTSGGFTGGLVVDFRAKHFNFFLGTDRFFGKLSKDFIPINHANANVSLGFSFPL